MANTASRDAELQSRRKAKIEGEVSKFFRRYRNPQTQTAETIIADANRWKKRLDPYAYQRIISIGTPARPTAPASRPSAKPNGSAYFNTPGAAATTPGGGLDPLWWILGGALVFSLLRH